MDTITVTNEEEQRLLTLDEDHFLDFKSKRIAPASLQKLFVAFANTDTLVSRIERLPEIASLAFPLRKTVMTHFMLS